MTHPIAFTCRGLLAGAILGLAAATSHAAFVTWGAATDIAGDSDVVNTGTLFAAFNLGPTGVTSTTINGVPFAPAGDATSGITTTTSQSLSSAYLTLLNSAFLLHADNPTTVTFSGGLTVGQNYLFQAWVNNSGRDFSIFSRGDFKTTVSDGLGDDVNLYPGDNGVGVDPMTDGDLPPAPGQYVIGTFVADSTSQVFTFTSGEIDGVLNGFQLREISDPIPEPGTMVAGLAVAGVAALSGLRRRR